MITFCILVVAFGIMLAIAACGIVAVGAIAAGGLLVALDVAIGVAPFIGIVLLISWLFKKRG